MIAYFLRVVNKLDRTHCHVYLANPRTPISEGVPPVAL